MLLMAEHFWPASVRSLKPAEDRWQAVSGQESCLALNWGGLEATTRAFVF